MPTLIASYYICTDDKNLFLLLDSTVWRTLDRIPGVATGARLWYLETESSPTEMCQNIVAVFENKKKELIGSYREPKVIENSKISINVHDFKGDRWATHNDKSADEWIEEKVEKGTKPQQTK